MEPRNKTILIFPWARALRNGQFSAKHYPYWSELVQLLKQEGYKVIQVSKAGEQLIGADELILDKSLKELKELINNCLTVITVDTFANHFCWYVGKKAIVLFAQSDPNIFGHPENINLLTDRKYLRQGYKQYDVWEGVECINEAFVSPQEVLKTLKANFN